MPLEQKQAAETPVKRAAGRPSRDWHALFQAWLASGQPKVDFLLANGLDPRSGHTRAATSEWEGALAVARDRLATDLTTRLVESKAVSAAMVEATGEISRADLEAGAGPPPAMQVLQPESSWQLITRWRSNQAGLDWRTSDQIRAHIDSMLAQRMREVVETSPDGLVSRRLESTLKAHEVRSIALALGEVQRIQRLAIGLSTENIGIDGPIDPNVEKSQGTETNPNLFVVELTRGGKFTRARPRRA